MFGIDSSELLLIAVVALVVIGPKDMPRVMRMVGGWVGRGRAMTRHLRAGFDTMMREAELEEMQKQWAAQNADIMAATAVTPGPVPATPSAGMTDDVAPAAEVPVMLGPQPPSSAEPVTHPTPAPPADYTPDATR